MNEKKTPVWVKVFIFMLASIVAALCGLWILFGWLVALIGGAGLLALYIPAIIIISFYAARRRQKISKRAQRRHDAKRHKERDRWIIYNGSCMCGRWLKHGWVDGKWVPVEDHIQYSSNSRRTTYYKKQSNRKVRRTNEVCGKGGQYKRCYEYWWHVI